MPLSGKTVAVLGAAGFIGRAVVRAFADAGASVRCIDSIGNRKDEENLKWYTGDAHELSFLGPALEGCESVVNLASNSLPASSNADLAAEIQSDVVCAVKVAEMAFSLGAERFIFPSSGGTVYGADWNTPIPENAPTRPRSAYAVSKLSVEHYLRILNEIGRGRCLSLRISNPFGEGQFAKKGQGFVARAMECAVKGEALAVWGDGSAIRDFVYIRDVAQAFLRACMYDGKFTEINIGSGAGRSLREIIKATEEATKRPIDVRYEPGRSIDVAVNVLDITLAREQLGWIPATSFDKAMRITAEWWLGLQRRECRDLVDPTISSGECRAQAAYRTVVPAR